LHSTASGIRSVLAVGRGVSGNCVFLGLQFCRIQILRLLAAHSLTGLKSSCWSILSEGERPNRRTPRMVTLVRPSGFCSVISPASLISLQNLDRHFWRDRL